MLLIGEKYRRRLETALKNFTADIVWLPDNPCVDERLRGHADLMVYAESGNLIATSETYNYLVNNLTSHDSNIRLIKAQNQQSEIYPHDCGLCVRSTGSFDIYNPKTIDPAVSALLYNQPLHVNQGYAACAICAVNNNTVITSDAGIASNVGIFVKVLKIRPGFIALPGFDYGFIGGAAFLLDDHTLAFTGSLDHHPDKDRILEFLDSNNVRPVYLTDEPIFDIGGVIQLP